MNPVSGCKDLVCILTKASAGELTCACAIHDNWHEVTIMKNRAKRTVLPLLAILVLTAVGFPTVAAVVKDGQQTFLVDRTGERWDITQAVSIGFDPDGFEFGIGRYAFNPLDDSHWQQAPADTRSGMRVIGVADEADAHAYSVRKLSYHETANTFLGDNAIVAGY